MLWNVRYDRINQGMRKLVELLEISRQKTKLHMFLPGKEEEITAPNPGL